MGTSQPRPILTPPRATVTPPDFTRYAYIEEEHTVTDPPIDIVFPVGTVEHDSAIEVHAANGTKIFDLFYRENGGPANIGVDFGNNDVGPSAYYRDGAFIADPLTVGHEAIKIGAWTVPDYPWRIFAGGRMEWSDGTNQPDIGLERTADNVLSLDGADFKVFMKDTAINGDPGFELYGADGTRIVKLANRDVIVGHPDLSMKLGNDDFGPSAYYNDGRITAVPLTNEDIAFMAGSWEIPDYCWTVNGGGEMYWRDGLGGGDESELRRSAANEMTWDTTLKLTKALGLTSVAPASVPNNSLFLTNDVGGGVLSWKDSTGVVHEVTLS